MRGVINRGGNISVTMGPLTRLPTTGLIGLPVTTNTHRPFFLRHFLNIPIFLQAHANAEMCNAKPATCGRLHRGDIFIRRLTTMCHSIPMRVAAIALTSDERGCHASRECLSGVALERWRTTRRKEVVTRAATWKSFSRIVSTCAGARSAPARCARCKCLLRSSKFV